MSDSFLIFEFEPIAGQMKQVVYYLPSLREGEFVKISQWGSQSVVQCARANNYPFVLRGSFLA